MLRFIKKTICGFLVTVLAFGFMGHSACALEPLSDPALDRLNEFVAMVREEKAQSFGFPGNQNVQLTEAIVNNVGDPFNNTDPSLNALDFEREVIEFFRTPVWL